MTTQPRYTPILATDPLYVGPTPWTGTPTRVRLGSAEAAAGIEPGQRLDAQVYNSQMGEVGDHLATLADTAVLTYPDIVDGLDLGDWGTSPFIHHVTIAQDSNRKAYLCYTDVTSFGNPVVHGTIGGRTFTSGITMVSASLGIYGAEPGYLFSSMTGGTVHVSTDVGGAWASTSGGGGSNLPVSTSTDWILGFSHELQRWIGVSDDNGLATSPAFTGVGHLTWTSRTIPGGSTWPALPTRICAPGPGETGHGVILPASSRYYYSLDGVTFTSVAQAMTNALWSESHQCWYALNGATLLSSATVSGPWTTVSTFTTAPLGMFAFGRNIVFFGLSTMRPGGLHNIDAALRQAGNVIAYDGSVMRVVALDLGDGAIDFGGVLNGRPVLVSRYSSGPVLIAFAFGLRGPWAT
jgi:hypothetical protein